MNKKSGVTLMIMVITIVAILIISAGVTLNLGKTGIIKNTRKLDVQAQMKVYQFELEDYIKVQMQLDPNYDKKNLNVEIIAGDTNAEIENKTKRFKEIVPSFDEKYRYDLMIKEGTLYLVKAINKRKERTKWIIETGINIYQGGNILDNIPDGFEIVPDDRPEDVKQVVEHGVIIRDKSNGNQFVWIPVPNMAKFHRYPFQKILSYETNNLNSVIIKGLFEAEFNGNKMKREKTEGFNEFEQSVKENGGFFVGRYETMEETDPKTKENYYQTAGWAIQNEYAGDPLKKYANYNLQNKPINLNMNFAFEKCRNMYKDHPQVQSNGMYGTAFDYIINMFIEKEITSEIMIRDKHSKEISWQPTEKITTETFKYSGDYTKDVDNKYNYIHGRYSGLDNSKLDSEHLVDSYNKYIEQVKNKKFNQTPHNVTNYCQYGICDLIGGINELTMELVTPLDQNGNSINTLRGGASIPRTKFNTQTSPTERYYSSYWTDKDFSPRVILYYKPGLYAE